jgi:CubicO group peptidase (beta-lactamase class C family)
MADKIEYERMSNSVPKFSPKAIVRNISLVTGGLAVIGGTAIAFNWTFLRRVATHPNNSITNVDWYKPLATVKGKPSAIPRATSKSIPQDSLNKISAYAQAHNSSALLVLHKGKIVLERHWRGFTPTATSNSMSLSKTVVALLIGIAIEEGHIDSELDPVAKYIPEWSKDERSKITLQDLLYMQSGLRNEDNTDSLTSDLVQMYAGLNANAVARKVPAIQSPGKAFDYNNVNTQILGIVLERATGEKYVDYLSTRLWQPLQANDAAIWLDRPQGHPKTFCCMFATPQDWGKVGQLFLNRGKVNNKQIVASAWLDKMIQPPSVESSYGYHIWLKAKTKNKPGGIKRRASQPFLAKDTIYLDGKSLQKVYIIPAHDLVVVRIGEQPDKWDDSVIPNTLISSLSNRHASKKR